MEILAKDKHSSSLGTFISYEYEKCCEYGPSTQTKLATTGTVPIPPVLYYKRFTIVIYDRSDSGLYYKTTNSSQAS
jgi:hypothetical protein